MFRYKIHLSIPQLRHLGIFQHSLDEFCDGYPHNMLPTPGYWIECSRAISNQGSAWTNEDCDLQEIDEGITDSPDGSFRDANVATDYDPTDPAAVPR